MLNRNPSLSTLLNGDLPEGVENSWLKLKMDSNAMLNRSIGTLGNSSRPPIPYKQKVPGQPTGLTFMAIFNEDEFACRQHDGTGFLVNTKF